ncbi:LolA family protein [Phenylobacterium deserti]|uniref:Outer membrane lipoprotein carrier protein LolA n=1 Tax=Phenylobacterium deserti TaxID=1914756 RepID=A0A328AUS7_9CAUL|nr:outer membrane lipoprotein carrier protein LolA [Phenylobacterium deserti]RAK57294.1 outer membrane lipoprotein carrier protein LolA [Phenylobacterium deserti]
MSLTRRSLALGSLAGALAASVSAPALAQGRLSAADRQLVDRAVAYLEGLTSARGRFTQTDSNGRTTTGTLFMQRPGKARFAYDAPSRLLVVSNGSTVAVQDGRLNSFSSYPLSSTPLSLFLARNIRLDRGVQVVQVRRAADGFTLVARDLRKQTAGQIELTFADNPLRLASWVVVDAQRRATRVNLQGLQPASGLDPALFVLNDPRKKNVGRGKL